MGCKGSKHALHGHGGGGGEGCGAGLPRPRAPEQRRYSGLVGRHSVALRSSTLGTRSLDRAAAAAAAAAAAMTKGVPFVLTGGEDEATMKAGNDDTGVAAGKYGPSRSFTGWRPTTPPPVAVVKRRRRVTPRTPNKTPAHASPEEINVWELMEGLDDDDDDQEEEEETEHDNCVGRKARSAPGSPAFDPEILDAFRRALDELSSSPASPPPPPPPRFDAVRRDDDVVKTAGEIQMLFPGIVRDRVSAFQEKIDAKQHRHRQKQQARTKPPPESARQVVVYLTSLRGVRQTYEACRSTGAVLRGYGVRVDERDLSLHAAYKDELRAALALGDAGAGLVLPQVFADGRHLGGAEEVRRLHETGELAKALSACDAAPPSADKQGGSLLEACCGGCGGVRFVPCDVCSGSCKVFVVEDEDGAGAGAFRRCPECNENGLVRCPLC